MSNDTFVSEGYRDGLSPEDRMRIVAQTWDEIGSEDSGATDGVALEELMRDVTEAMTKRDVDLAESLTCKAFLLISGMI